jgi:magnesium chelatase family protein
MLVRAHGFALDRGTAVHAEVELDLRAGLPGLAVIGLGAGRARDLRERVQAAVLNSGFAFPRRRVTVNIAPPAPRGGPELDLAVACCALAANGDLDGRRLERVGLCAELGLGGELRGCGAGEAIAEAAAAAGLVGIVLAGEDRAQALASGALPVASASTLEEVVALLRAPRRPTSRAAGAARAHADSRLLTRSRRPR